MFGRARRLVADLLDRVRRQRRAAPREFGYSGEKIETMVERARGDTVTRDRLLGPAPEAPVVEHLQPGEQPHHAVPGTGFEVETEDEELSTERGYLVVTDQRVLVLVYRGLTVGRNEVEYDHVEAVGRTTDDGEVHLTLRTPARTLRMRTDENRWGGDLEAALDMILAEQPA